ncbi:MAG: hypothetical protein R3B93_26950 [Bacteroidia bacterium]
MITNVSLNSLGKYLKSLGINKTKFKIQKVRIWRDNYATIQAKMIRLVHYKNQEWFAQSLDYFCYNEEYCNLDEYILDTVNLVQDWPSKWRNIIEKGLLDLPDQKRLNQKLEDETGKLLAIGDGEAFTIEVLTRKGRKQMVYQNPESYAGFYAEEGKFYKGYEKILQLIELLKEAFDWKFLSKEPKN